MNLHAPLVALSLLLLPAVATAEESVDPADPVLVALQTELQALQGLIGPADAPSAIADHSLFGAHPAYFVGLQAVELQRYRITGEEGGLQGWSPLRGRWIHVDVRVGEATLDSTHALRDGSWDDMSSGRGLPVGDDVELLRRAIRREAEVRFRGAVERYQRVLSDRQLLVEEESGYDLAPTEPASLLETPGSFEGVDWAAWEDVVRQVSAEFAGPAVAMDPSVSLVAEQEIRWFVSSEGHVSRTVDTRARLAISADTLAADGTEIYEDAHFDGRTLDDLPDVEVMKEAADGVLERLAALRDAPEEPPYEGPAILSGRAAAVFFHEILGHRVEGHRLKEIADAQTFRDKVGESILPSFLSVIDDPTQARYGGVDLRGHYRIDDQGVPATRATIVTDGVLEGFLESRSPVGPHMRSNGHGRRQPGLEAVTRQGNLLIESSDGFAEAELERRAVALAKKQGLEYALLIDDLEGGFTFTDRDLPNAFQIDVRTGWRLFVDGRPRQLVRGIDLIGTPLQTFSRIVAAGTEPAVFNGTCGAESGWVPVSAAAPAMLVSQIETQRKLKGQAPPPLTDAPPAATSTDELPPLLRLLGEEADRAKATLQINGAPAPSRVTIETWDRDAWEVTASFGVLVGSGGGRARPSRVEVVVEGGGVSSLRFDGGAELDVPTADRNPTFVVDDVPVAVQRDLWLSADGAYRGAIQRLQLKQTELAGRAEEDIPPDWTDAEIVVFAEVLPPPPIDRDRLQQFATSASRAARGVAGIRASRAAVREEQGHYLLANTEGTRIQELDGFAALHVEIEALRADGMPVRDRLSWVARSAAELPPEGAVRFEVRQAASELVARAQAPVVPWFEGPVVFEGEAAADLFRYLLAPELRGTPPAPAAGTTTASQLRGGPRIGRRVLPSGWTVVDDPTNRPAAPIYDREGVKARKVSLVEDGHVVDLLMTRVPRAGLSGSNGHGRGTLRGPAEARFTTWTVSPRRGLSPRAFDRKVVAARKAAQADRVLVVRRFANGWDGTLPEVLSAVWVAADGQETPAVGLEIEEVDRRTLRQVIAASSAVEIRPYLGSTRATGMAPSTRGVPMGILAPHKVLVDDLEVAFAGNGGEPELLPLVELSAE